ncbi:MAG: hypothetical protein R3C32_06655 [Chloroflexota bacterium]
MGEPAGVAGVLREVIRPRTAYLAARPELLDAVGVAYRVADGPPMVRMWVDRSTFRPAAPSALRLVPADVGDLNRLYDFGLGSWLPSESVANGVYYGIRVNGQRVWRRRDPCHQSCDGLAAVGNVLTDRNYRGRGFAKVGRARSPRTCCASATRWSSTSASTTPRRSARIAPWAIRSTLRFEERLVSRRGSVWDSIPGPSGAGSPRHGGGPDSKE